MVQQKEKCCGCTACQAVCPKHAIKMVEDKEGFLYPQITESLCHHCGLCEKVCPILTPRTEVTPLSCHAAIHQDQNTVAQSSSGGIFSVLAEWVLAQDGCVCGAAFDSEWHVRHIWAESREDAEHLKRSKYVQSDMTDIFPQVKQRLASRRWVLFSGTPCQIAGLNLFLGKKYDHLLTMDFVCHSIPSPKVWRLYLNEILKRNHEEKATGISFRSKRNGWDHYSLEIDTPKHPTDQGGLLCEAHQDNLYMQGFLCDMTVRPSCSACPARNLSSHSDITLADAWGISEYISPVDWLNNNRGASIVLLNNPKAQSIWEEIKGDVISCPISYDYVEPRRAHCAIAFSSPLSIYRNYFFSRLEAGNNILDLLAHCIMKIQKRRRRNAIVKKILMFFMSPNVIKNVFQSKISRIRRKIL